MGDVKGCYITDTKQEGISVGVDTTYCIGAQAIFIHFRD